MKKSVFYSVLVALPFVFANTAPASVFSLWANDDEEYQMNRGNTAPKMTRATETQSAPRNTTPTQYPDYERTNISSQTIDTGISQGQPQKIAPSPVYTPGYDTDNLGSVDYDTLQAERNINDGEILNSIDKWQLGIKNVYWENYRGNNVRVEVLRNNRDLKEMRLKFVQSQDMIADPDGSISDMLNKVADQVMKRTCGKKAKQAIILYERPSVELVKETSYDNYKVIARGTSLKEYGFRCIY